MKPPSDDEDQNKDFDEWQDKCDSTPANKKPIELTVYNFGVGDNIGKSFVYTFRYNGEEFSDIAAACRLQWSIPEDRQFHFVSAKPDKHYLKITYPLLMWVNMMNWQHRSPTAIMPDNSSYVGDRYPWTEGKAPVEKLPDETTSHHNYRMTCEGNRAIDPVQNQFMRGLMLGLRLHEVMVQEAGERTAALTHQGQQESEGVKPQAKKLKKEEQSSVWQTGVCWSCTSDGEVVPRWCYIP